LAGVRNHGRLPRVVAVHQGIPTSGFIIGALR